MVISWDLMELSGDLPSGNFLHSDIEAKAQSISMIYPFKIVIFHSYVNVYQRVAFLDTPIFRPIDVWSIFFRQGVMGTSVLGGVCGTTVHVECFFIHF